MISQDLEDIDVELRRSFDNPKISARVLLDRFSVIDESSRLSPAYVDERYSGFYYHLGKLTSPASLLEAGFDLGLLSGSFLISCKTVEKFLGFREQGEEYFSYRIGSQNIRRVMKGKRRFYMGSLYDDQLVAEFGSENWDMVMISSADSNSKQMEYIEYIWPYVADGGIIAYENLGKNDIFKEGFLSFCESKNRKAYQYPTRYGTGLVQK